MVHGGGMGGGTGEGPQAALQSWHEHGAEPSSRASVQPNVPLFMKVIPGGGSPEADQRNRTLHNFTWLGQFLSISFFWCVFTWEHGIDGKGHLAVVGVKHILYPVGGSAGTGISATQQTKSLHVAGWSLNIFAGVVHSYEEKKTNKQ